VLKTLGFLRFGELLANYFIIVTVVGTILLGTSSTAQKVVLGRSYEPIEFVLMAKNYTAINANKFATVLEWKSEYQRATIIDAIGQE
jgi:hypothetical protein